MENRNNGADNSSFERKPSFNREERGGDRKTSFFRREDRPGREESTDRRSFNPNFDDKNRVKGGGERRSFGGDRPSFNREGGERRSYNNDRPSYNREGGERRSFGGDRPNFNRGERPSFDRNRSDRPSFNREGGERRSFNNDRPSFNSEGGERRSFGGDRPNFNKGERPNFDRNRSDRPSFNREGGERRSFNNDRPSFNSEGGERRSFGGDRPNFNRGERPGFDRNRSDRPAFNREGGERRSFNNDRPSFGRDGGERRSFGGDRPKFDRGERSERPNFNREGGERRSFDRDRSDRPSFNRGGNERRSFHRDDDRGFGGDRRFDRKHDKAPENPYISEELNVTSELLKGDIRLNRYVSMSGICSRRDADALIESGRISVNGEVVTALGSKVSANDVIAFDGEVIRGEKNVYILMNKPKDYVTTLEDPNAEKIVTQLLKGQVKERVYPVGRLDKNSLGVLVLTNDGEFTKILTHPSFNKKKIYHVLLDRPLREEDMEKLATGVELEDGLIFADEISCDQIDKREVGIEIHSGRNRVVRRMFESVGYKVRRLDRVYFAGLTKKGLQRGEWRYLTQQEVESIKKEAKTFL